MKKVYLVDRSKCAYNSCGRPCITNCPVTITNIKKKGKMKTFPAIDFKNSTNEIIIHSEYCIKCGICINKCPKNAIFVKNLVEEDRTQQIIHQYSKDGFRLYNLPTLNPGRVTGLCGPNGIGKSTILNILSMNLKPNFGDFKAQTSDQNFNNNTMSKPWSEIAKNIKDANIRNHFIDSELGLQKISYKKQVLKVLFKEYEGQTIKAILEEKINKLLRNQKNPNPNASKIKNLSSLNPNEIKKISEYIELIYDALDLKVIEERQLHQCSGGELQRFAIANVLLSDADVILIDEPVTFLDVKKRIKLAEMLQTSALVFNKAVLVVEHDLTILDYMSDVIHLFYGEPHQFGIITRVQPVRTGINSYLTGFLKNENIQFRPNKIRFRKSISGRTWSEAQVFAHWDNIKIRLSSKEGNSEIYAPNSRQNEFNLTINPGILYQNEILGVVGENGLGKTTWFKSLIGKIEPVEGKFNLTQKFAVSYKPQYITQNYDGTVEDMISEYSKKYIHTDELLEKLYEPLGVDKLLNTDLRKLSGGQLQRAFIAACLTKDANIYLIDEPSAYLDVEERLKIAEIIRTHTKSRNASAICIEHDIQITDALADRLLIFLGTPGKEGFTKGPLHKRDGMNLFLKNLDVTFRRDEETGRARINKKGSSLDQKQRAMGEYYYTKISNQKKFI